MRLTLAIDLGPGRTRRWVLGIVCACLCLASCPVWPSAQIAFSRSYYSPGEWTAVEKPWGIEYAWREPRWVVEWQTWGETYRVYTSNRNAMRIVDAILWERGRRE